MLQGPHEFGHALFFTMLQGPHEFGHALFTMLQGPHEFGHALFTMLQGPQNCPVRKSNQGELERTVSKGEVFPIAFYLLAAELLL
eukprot:1158098-Pelagomonas_calceolata.AAC.7